MPVRSTVHCGSLEHSCLTITNDVPLSAPRRDHKVRFCPTVATSNGWDLIFRLHCFALPFAHAQMMM